MHFICFPVCSSSPCHRSDEVVSLCLCLSTCGPRVSELQSFLARSRIMTIPTCRPLASIELATTASPVRFPVHLLPVDRVASWSTRGPLIRSKLHIVSLEWIFDQVSKNSLSFQDLASSYSEEVVALCRGRALILSFAGVGPGKGTILRSHKDSPGGTISTPCDGTNNPKLYLLASYYPCITSIIRFFILS